MHWLTQPIKGAPLWSWIALGVLFLTWETLVRIKSPRANSIGQLLFDVTANVLRLFWPYGADLLKKLGTPTSDPHLMETVKVPKE